MSNDLNLTKLPNSTSTEGFIIDGIKLNDRTGYSVVSAGDVNKDGYSDVIIGAPYDGAGRAYVIYGGRGLKGINLASINSSQGFIIDGINTGDWTGCSVATAGDINNDGYSDMIIGAEGYPSGSYIGRAYVIYGGNSLESIELASLASSQGFIINGINEYDFTGHSVASAGDVNKDGYYDMVVVADAYPSGSGMGRAYVVYGGSNLNNINLANLTSAQGFVIDGINGEDSASYSVAITYDQDFVPSNY